jgi:hypothetical protein
MRARKSDPLHAINRGDPIKKMHKRNSGRQIKAIRIDRLTEQHDLFATSMHRDFDLALNFVNVSRNLWAARRGHDALRAALIASTTN